MHYRDLRTGAAILALTATLQAAPVALQRATATVSQTLSGDFSIANTLLPQGPGNLGWAIYDGPWGPPYPATATGAQTAVFETVENLGFTNGTTLTFTLSQLLAGAPQHTIGRLRLSATTAPREEFADGLATAGQVGTNWIVLEPAAFATDSGGPVTALPDRSLLFGGISPATDVYHIRAYTSLTGITGFRLEVLEDPSLPGDGPGRQPENGNFVLTGFEVSALAGRVTNVLVPSVLSLSSTRTPSTQTAVIPLRIHAAGIENALGFSLAFDPARLSFLNASPVPALSNLVVTLDTSQLPAGRLGVTAALPPGGNLAAGSQEVLQLRFNTARSPGDFQTAITLTNVPTPSRLLSLDGSEVESRWNSTTLQVAGTREFPQFRLPSFAAMAGTEVDIPVTLVSYGSESALSFTLNYGLPTATFLGIEPNPALAALQILANTNSLSTGRIGIIAALPTGQTLGAGTNELGRIRLRIPISVTGLFPLRFQGSPTPQQVVNAAAQPIEAQWMGGGFTALPAELEADVHPRSTPNRLVNISDWVQVGRFVAALDEAAPGAEFQRADCAPLTTAGNGLLTVSDWVQAGRSAAGLDPLTLLGGPTQPSAAGPNRRRPAPAGPTDRVLRAVADEFLPGRTNEVAVHFQALGDENAVAFSVAFDPRAMEFVDSRLGAAAGPATWNLNTRQLANGRVGVALALNVGGRFAAADGPLLHLRFRARGAAGSPLQFADGPVIREVASPAALPLPATWVDTSIAVTQPSLSMVFDPADPATPVVLSWSALFTGARLQAADRLHPDAWRELPDTPVLSAGRQVVRLPASANAAFFRIEEP
ncbi:MAG: hypothetical protein ACKOET_08315 [Verrucomicrobiota bacterium]